MSDLIGTGVWAEYERIFNEDAQDMFFKETLIWYKASENNLNLLGGERSLTYTQIPLKALCTFNVFRTWPITEALSGGDNDKQTMALIINKKYLKDLGHLNSDNYFEFSPSLDKFKYDGIFYEAKGDTASSQTKNDELYVQMILSRLKPSTGQSYFSPDVL